MRVVRDKVPEFRISHDNSIALPPLLELLLSSLLVIFWASFDLWMFCNEIVERFHHPEHFFCKQYLLSFFFVERTAGSLSDKLRIDNSALNTTTHDLRVENLSLVLLVYLFFC